MEPTKKYHPDEAANGSIAPDNDPSESGTPENIPSAVYIARQPIFNADGLVHAYELLYRNTEQNISNASSVGDEEATGTVISESILNFGMYELTNGRKAFVNFAEGYLLNKAAYLLDPEQFVIEILENVVFTIEVIDALYTLKAAGFDVALDDYIGTPIPPEILSLIDIIKIDFKDTTKEQRASFSPPLIAAGKTLLAEKVETKEDVLEALNLGCKLLQGYYFSKPVMLKKSSMEISSVSYMKLSKELTAPDINLDNIAWVINSDAHLTYKLLRRMSTLQYYRGNNITSIKRALVLMGNEEIRRWIMLILLRDMSNTKSDELIRTALIRAFMCEKLARESGRHDCAAEAYSTGMLSILADGSRNLEERLNHIQLLPSVRDALSGKDTLLKRLLDIAVCYETGNWNKLEYLMEYSVPELDLKLLPGLYMMSVSAADEMLSKEYS